MNIETIAGLGFGAFILIVAFPILLINGLSYDPDAWMDRHVRDPDAWMDHHVKYHRAQEGGAA